MATSVLVCSSIVAGAAILQSGTGLIQAVKVLRELKSPSPAEELIYLRFHINQQQEMINLRFKVIEERLGSK